MTIELSIPESIATQLRAEWGGDFERRTQEALAIEGYRSGALSAGQVAEMLGLSRYEADGFLKQRGVEPPFSLEEFHRSQSVLNSLLSQ